MNSEETVFQFRDACSGIEKAYMDPNKLDDGWGEHRMLVMAELKRLEHLMLSVQKEISRLQVEVMALKVKSGAWGMIGGMLASGSTILIALLITYMKSK